MPLIDRVHYHGDFETNQQVDFRFVSKDATEALTLDISNVGNTGAATFSARNASSGATSTVGLTVNINESTGVHHVQGDTTGVFYANGNDYEIFITDGEVNDGTSRINVTGDIVGRFSYMNRTGGFVLDRSVKVLNGSVTAVGSPSNRAFTLALDSVDHSGYPDNSYANQRIIWQNGTLQGTGGTLLRSTPNGTDIDVVTQKGFVTAAEVGWLAVILPEEQPPPHGVSQTTVEFGPTQTKISWEWTVDGVMVRPDNGTSIIDMWILDTGQQVITAQLATEVTGGQGDFHYVHNIGTIPQLNQTVRVVTEAVIDGVTHRWPRVIPYASNQ